MDCIKKCWNRLIRFNDLCKAVKEDRKQNSAMDKDVLSEIEPEDRLQHRKKRRKKIAPVAKAFVDSDNDESDVESEQDGNESSDDEWHSALTIHLV